MNFLYQIFSEDLIYALGWTVLHSFWQALAIGILMAIGMMLLQDKPAKTRYELAAFSLFLVFISALATFLVYFETGQATDSFVTMGLQEDVVAVLAAETGILSTSTLESYLQYFNQNIPLVVAVWFLGVCFFLLRLMGGLAYIQRLKYTNNKPVSDFWTKRVAQLSKQLKLRRSVKLMESSLATVPMVIGYIKPVILMPIGTINGLSQSEVNAILAHELAHVYRNDFILNIFLSVIEVFFYFNPAVWWIAANIRTERENCCDDVAITLCGNSLVYAKALLRLQELSQTVPGYAMAFAGPKNQLLHRIRRILHQPRTRSNMLEKFTATCLLMVTVVLFSIGANSYSYNKNLQQQYFSNEMNDLLANNQFEELEIPYTDFLALQDTTPKSKKQRYIKKSDEGEVELEIEEGDISKLVIDGEEIPQNELGEYNEMIDQLIHEMESVPNVKWNAQSNHPNAKAHSFDFKNKKTITTETEDNGHTRIIIQSNGEEPTEIVLNKEQDFIFIDGTRLQGGDTAVIIDEKSRYSVLGQKGNHIKFRQSFTDEAIESEINKAFGIAHGDLDKSIAEMEKMLADMKLRQEEIKRHSFQLREESINQQRANREAQEQRIAITRKEIEHELAAKREAVHRIQREARSRDVESLRKAELEMVRLRSYNADKALQLEGKSAIYFNDDIKAALVHEMVKDGLITNDQDYSFELTTRSFKVNDKKQAASLAKKYLELYEKLSKHKMNTSGHIKYENKNGQTKSSFRSSGVFDMDDFKYYSYFFMLTPETFKLIKPCPKRIEGLESLSFLITPIEFKPGLTKLT